MEEIFKAITNFGFPIVVASFLLFRFEKKLEMLEQAINGKDGIAVLLKDLIDEVKRLCGK